MPKVVFIEHSGVEHIVDVSCEESLMEGAVWSRVPGMVAACGGDGGCATCQVYVDKRWSDCLEPASTSERNTLRFAFERKPNSRLACQIRMSDTLEGVVLRLPSRQF